MPVVDERDFPREWRQGEQRLDVTYRFEPGAEDDGVTVRIPLPLLPSIRSVGFDWLVPGLRTELVAALLKTLPKPIRRNVVPANDWAPQTGGEIPPAPRRRTTTLVEFLARQIRSLTYTPVDIDDFELDRLPDHLRVTFAVIDDRGQVVGAQQRPVGTATQAAAAHAGSRSPNDACATAQRPRGGLRVDHVGLRRAAPQRRDEAQRRSGSRLPSARGVWARPSTSVSWQPRPIRPAPSALAFVGCCSWRFRRRPPTCSSTSPRPRSYRSRRAPTARTPSSSTTASPHASMPLSTPAPSSPAPTLRPLEPP